MTGCVGDTDPADHTEEATTRLTPDDMRAAVTNACGDPTVWTITAWVTCAECGACTVTVNGLPAECRECGKPLGDIKVMP